MADLDNTFDCSYLARPLLFRTEISAALLNNTVWCDTAFSLTTSISATQPTPNVIACLPIRSDTSIFAEVYNGLIHTNAVAWSKIGEVTNFSLDNVNDAGYRMMPWNGWVLQTKALGKNVVVYGSDGIATLYPVKEPFPTFGFKILSQTGIMSKYTVTGTENIHYFINARGDLVKLVEDKIEVLGYAEFLLPLKSTGFTLMHYDEKNSRIYICNGTTGYIYSDPFGLGGGPAAITSIQLVDNETFLVSPSTITIPNLNICTDTLDLGLRTDKTLWKIEVASSDPSLIYFAIDYRSSVQQAWKTTAWKALNRKGEGFTWVTGLEFRIKLKTLVAFTTSIDEIKIFAKNSGDTK